MSVRDWSGKGVHIQAPLKLCLSEWDTTTLFGLYRKLHSVKNQRGIHSFSYLDFSLPLNNLIHYLLFYYFIVCFSDLLCWTRPRVWHKSGKSYDRPGHLSLQDVITVCPVLCKTKLLLFVNDILQFDWYYKYNHIKWIFHFPTNVCLYSNKWTVAYVNLQPDDKYCFKSFS